MTDAERLAGAFEVLNHVRASEGRYRCRWCGMEAYDDGRVGTFPHIADCPTLTLRKQADELTTAQRERDEVRNLCVEAGMTAESTVANYLQGVFYALQHARRERDEAPQSFRPRI